MAKTKIDRLNNDLKKIEEIKHNWWKFGRCDDEWYKKQMYHMEVQIRKIKDDIKKEKKKLANAI